ncbi:MAG: hypothetical protein ACREMB_06085 [Candidatus Rokuibacteriota bacterium]
MDWPSLVRKYVWDAEKTPYLVPADRLTPRQIRNELFVYAFLLAVLAALVLAVTATGARRPGPLASPAVALYALTLLAAAIGLGATGHPAAAAYCASVPVVTGLGALLGLLRPDMTGAERVVLAALSTLWLGYAARVVRIALRLRGGK